MFREFIKSYFIHKLFQYAIEKLHSYCKINNVLKFVNDKQTNGQALLIKCFSYKNLINLTKIK